MPVTTTTISNDLLSSTLYTLMDELRDGLYQKTAFLDHARKLGGIEEEDGGTKLVVPISTAEHTVITAHTSGWEAQNMVFNDISSQAEYDYADFSAPIGITKAEELRNKGDKAKIKIIETRAKSVMGLLSRSINSQVLAGAGGVVANMNTLNGEADATGFMENHAWGTGGGQTNTVGGLVKNTVDVNGWYNQRQTCGSSFSTTGLRLMKQLLHACNSQAEKDEIKLIIMSEAGRANYERILVANERYINEQALNGGRIALAFGNAVVEQDLAMPVNAGVGTDEFTAYFLNFESVKMHVLKGGDFAVSPFQDLTGHVVRAATLYFSGQLAAHHLGSVGVLVDGDTWV